MGMIPMRFITGGCGRSYPFEAGIVSPFLHIGCGSNLLFEKDYEGTVLHSRIGGVEVTAEDDERVSVRVGAGVIWLVRSRESVSDTR